MKTLKLKFHLVIYRFQGYIKEQDLLKTIEDEISSARKHGAFLIGAKVRVSCENCKTFHDYQTSVPISNEIFETAEEVRNLVIQAKNIGWAFEQTHENGNCPTQEEYKRFVVGIS